MSKHEIRTKVKKLRGLLSELERAEAAERVFDKLEKTAAFLLADRILMYHSLPDELDTHAFLRKWASRKRFFLPRVSGLDLEILPYDEATLSEGSYHIQEPHGSRLAKLEDMEMIVVPGVAFDSKGNRLGRGKGFYDRMLQGSKAPKIGVAYELQIVESIPAETHDIRMDMIITDRTTIICSQTVSK